MTQLLPRLTFANPIPAKTEKVWGLIICGRCDTLPKLQAALKFFALSPGGEQVRHLLRLRPPLASNNPSEVFANAGELCGLRAYRWGKRAVRFARTNASDYDRALRCDFAVELSLICIGLVHGAGAVPQLERDIFPGYGLTVTW